MAEFQRIGDLEIDQDLDFNRRDTRFQRIGMGGMCVAALAAALVLTGSGPLSKAVAEGTRERVEYSRFCRQGVDTYLVVEQPAPGAGVQKTTITFEVSYLKKFEVRKITPEPESVVAEDRKLRYEFRTIT